MSEKRFGFAGFGPALFILVCLIAGLSLDSYPKYVISITMISMVIGAALVMLVGLGRCITLASGSVMAIGAYVSTLSMIRLGLPYVVAVFLAILAGAAAGWLIALPGRRFRGHNLAMVTLVFQSVCIILIREAKALTGGAEGIHVPPPSIFGWRIATDSDFLVLIGVASALSVLLMTILLRGPFGKNLQAAAGNEVAAEAFGVSVPDYLTAAFVVSSVAIAFAGALAAPPNPNSRSRELQRAAVDLHARLSDCRRNVHDLGRNSGWRRTCKSCQNSCGRSPIIRSCFSRRSLLSW